MTYQLNVDDKLLLFKRIFGEYMITPAEGRHGVRITNLPFEHYKILEKVGRVTGVISFEGENLEDALDKVFDWLKDMTKQYEGIKPIEEVVATEFPSSEKK